MVEINPELPWGHWLHVEQRPGLVAALRDPATGDTWRSVREAFWIGRLNMPLRNGEPDGGMVELLHAALAIEARRVCGFDELADDLYRGNREFATWHGTWLKHVGLTADASETGSPLTDEGWSVLPMLAATRPVAVRSESPRFATVRQLTELGLGPEERAARLDRLEAEAGGWTHAFVRRDVGHRPGVALLGPSDGPIPVTRTDWMLAFDTAEQRDVFYDWLGHRLDRWHEWGAFASRLGTAELTHRLLKVMASSLRASDASGR